MIGSILDKYEVLQKVGEGGMATVYRGRHTTLGRDVAIKVLHPHLSSSTRNRKRFAREARAIENLKHTNILEIFDYSGNEAEDCYIVTEFVQGETLTDLIHRNGQFPSEVVAMVGSDLAHALDFAHRSGILHRDIKPDNIMVRDDGTVKLMDFGIARFLDESQVTMTGALVGSPAYMSPEQAKEGDLDARSDLFSLGTVLFFLVTGSLPFAGSNPSLILKNIIEGNRPAVTELAPSMSASVADVIERLLQRDRDDRFNRASDVADALDQALAEVDFDRNRPTNTLIDYFREPEAWSRRLDQHLRHSLLAGGKRYLAAGDHLAALRLLNRLLSIDENNDEVLQLVQGLHSEPAAPSTRPRRAIPVVLGAIGLATLGVVGAAWWSGPQRIAVDTPEASPPPIQPAVIIEEEDPPQSAEPAPVPVVEAPVPIVRPMSPDERVAISRVPTATRADLKVVESVAAALSDAPAKVTFQVSGGLLWADVYCNKTRVSGTRPPSNTAEFPAGTHRCAYRSSRIFDEEFEFTVYPGETKTVVQTVRARPILVNFDAACEASCNVLLDKTLMGTVSSLKGVLSIDRPEEPHAVDLQCNNGSFSESYRGNSGSFLCRAP